MSRKSHYDNGSNDARSSYQRSIVSVEQTDLQSLRTPTNSKIQCACGKEVNSHAGLKRHQRSCRVIMGLNNELKQGIKLPKSESEWKTANSFFYANLPIEDMNTDGDFNDIATNFGRTVYDYFKNEYGIVREDEVNDFEVKYRNHTKNQLKQTLRKLKSDKTAENTSETRYVSKLLRSRIQNNQSKANESSSLDGIDHDSKIKNHFWKYVKLIFEKPAMVFPQFDKDACYQFFKNCFSRSKINRFNIPAWMPQYNNPKKSFNLQPPSYRDISKIISKMKAGAAACPSDQVSVLTLKKCPYLRTYLTCLIQKLWKGQNIPSV